MDTLIAALFLSLLPGFISWIYDGSAACGLIGHLTLGWKAVIFAALFMIALVFLLYCFAWSVSTLIAG